MTKYKPREISKILIKSLMDMPVVVLSGMRQTGKSTLLLNESKLKKRLYLSFDDFNTLELARTYPEGLLNNKQPMTIDEVQKLPEILPVIKQAVDKNRKPGRFILSGSANFLLLRNVAESLAGRAVYLTLHPFTRREILGYTKESPALIYFMHKGVFPRRRVEPIDWEEIVKGSMPPVCLNQVRNPNIWFRGFEQTYLERDIRTLSQVADLISFRHLLQLIAFRNTRIMKQSELARDAKLNVMTTSRYIALMEASFVINRVPPHLKNPAARLIKAPKLYLSDTGLAAHLIGIRTLNISEPLRGMLLENYVAQNLVGIFSVYDPEIRITYWNIQGRYEVDFIIEFNGDTIAIEVKNSTRWREQDLTGLKAYLSSNPKCRAGILAYMGSEVLKITDKIWVVPIHLILS
jgi:predicted AAA+ superfamily ATPase